jgi:hypothetical protein
LSRVLSADGIVRRVMRISRMLRFAAVPLALVLPAAATALAATKPTPTKKPTTVVSRHLWATIDACNAPHKKGMVGIRGSMPGTGRKDEKMYMRFRMQYESGGAWAYVGSTADTGFRPVGAATFKARQSGFYFTVPPVAGASYVLRGVVNFEWRKGTTVVLHAMEITTAGHISVAGADPPGYSAAACKLA